MRRNLYSNLTTGQLISPLTGTTFGGAVEISYTYKAANWPANTVGTNPWGYFDLQYGASSTGPWTTFATVSQESQDGSCISKSHSFNPPVGPLYIRWSATWTSGDFYLNFDDVVIEEEPPPLCSGTPEAGTILGTLIRPTCGGALPLPGTVTASEFSTGVTGLAFQWETSTDNVTWNNASGTGNTTATYTLPAHTGGQTEYYRLKVTCTNSGLFDVSDVVLQVSDQVAPETQVSNVSTSIITNVSATVNWTNGSGTRRYAVLNTVNSFTDPVSGSGPALVANSTYSGSGEQIIYDGTGSSVSISGLTANTTYYVRVYEYVRCGSSAPFYYYYNTSSSTDNPGSFTTALYCNSIPTSNDGLGITEVVISNVPFSVNDVTYYDNTATVINVIGGVLNPASITFATGYAYHAHIWIDLNDDGIFDNISELFFSGESNNNNPTTLNASFNLPPDATLGQHRMRIGTADSGQSLPDPCYSGSYGVTVDVTVNVTEPPTCFSPTSLTISDLNFNIATLSWIAADPVPSNGYDYYYSTINTAPDAGTTPSGSVGAGITSVNLTGLTANTTYYAWVRANCGGGDLSAWSSSISFTTLKSCDDLTAGGIVIASVPYNSGPGQTTCGNGQNVQAADVQNICGSGFYYGGEDKVYLFTPSTTASYQILLTTATDEDAGLTVYSGCPYTGECVGFAQSTIGLTRSIIASLESGITYYIVVDNWPSPACVTSYTLEVTELGPVPDCVTLDSPADDATGVLLTDALTWTPAATGGDPVSYRVYHGTANPPTVYTTVNAPTTTFVPTGRTYSTTYYWYVVPQNVSGPAVDCDVDIRSYTTDAPPAGSTCNNPMVISSIPFNSGTQSTCGFLNDYAAGYASCVSSIYGGGEDYVYQLEITTVPVSYQFDLGGATTYKILSIHNACPIGSDNCLGGVTTSSGSSATYVHQFTAPGTYYLVIDTWPSPDCGEFTLDITEAPQIPDCVTLGTPADDATGVLLTDALTWTPAATGGDPVSYRVYHGTANPPTGFNTVNAPTTTFVPTGRTYSTTYYWYVVPQNVSGQAVDCDVDIRSYTTEAPPPPPANDDCVNAIPFPIIPTNGVDCATVTVNTQSATGSPDVTCGGTEDDDVWYSFVVPIGVTTIHYSNSNISGSSDRMHQLFTSCGAPVAGACFDNESGSFSNLTPGATYILRTYTWNEGAVSNYTICLKTPLPPPVNDDCANAIEIPLNSGLPIDIVVGSIAGATASTGIPAGTGCNFYSDNNDIWYVINVPIGTQGIDIEMFATGGTSSLDNDYSMQVFKGTCGILEYIICNDDNINPYPAPSLYLPAITLPEAILADVEQLFVRVRKNSDASQTTFSIAATNYQTEVSLASGDCGSGEVTIDGPSGNAYRNVPLLDNAGGFVAEIYADGEDLGQVTSSVSVHNGAVRIDANGAPYLNRSHTVSVSNQPTNPVNLYTYFTNNELLDLQVADPSVTIENIKANKTDDACGDGPSTGGVLIDNVGDFANTTYSGTGYVVSSFSTFFLTGSAVPLPVNLISFHANALDARSILVSWNVSQEKDVRSYIVEKSMDGRNFEAMGSVAATQQSAYSLIDHKPVQDVNYYRLRIVDQSGAEVLSEIRQVHFANGRTLSIYPNPTSGSIFINGLETSSGTSLITVYNELGQEVWSGKMNGVALAGQGIDMTAFSAGAYWVKVLSDDVQTTLRFVKQ